MNPALNSDSPAERVLSVDVLRGFDMFWIIGGASIVGGLNKLGDNSVIRAVVGQLEHCEWEGCVFYDCIFPLFVFLAGVSIVFSMGRIRTEGGQGAAYRRIARRTLLLFVLGIFYSGGIAKGWDGVRILGVLQRIALCYGFTAFFFCKLNTRGLIAVCAGLLLGYWAWLSFVPVPGLGRTSFAMGENWSNYLDAQWLPLRKYDGAWDPEGILSTLPAIGGCMLGLFAGLLLKNSDVPAEKKGWYLIAAGLICLALGYAWGLQFPIVKKIWTSSFVLVTTGYSTILLGFFYQAIDIWKIRRWTTPFLWIGSNALAIYLAKNLVDFSRIAERLVGGPVKDSFGAAGALVLAITSLGLVVLLARFLYQRKIFLRI